MHTMSTAAKAAALNARITLLGATATLELWNGAKPASLGAPAGTKLATLNLPNPAGSVSGAVLTYGAYTQTNASHVAGTPTFVREKDSSGNVVSDTDIGAGSGNFQFTGTIATGQNITGTLTLTHGN